MADDRTTITELATGLGTTGTSSLREAMAERPRNLAISDDSWKRLERILAVGEYSAMALAAFANGVYFANHPVGLDRRVPRLIEWSGDRRIPGDQAVPADLLIDRVYMISCKYLSQILHNAAPARVFDDILLPSSRARHPDWFAELAPHQHLALYRGVLKLLSLEGMPDTPGWLDPAQRRRLRDAFRAHGRRGMPDELRAAYDALIAAVSERSAERWQESLREPAQQERMLWRLLRIYSATYYILGIDRHRTMRLRVMTPWEWRQTFEFRSLRVEPDGRGQPQVNWTACYRERGSGQQCEVHGHVEIRWSHRPFCGPPEAKIYLDTRHDEVPGYVQLDGLCPEQNQLRLLDSG
ncbi:MAG: hypothetical protein F4X12_12925 [Acidobacteriia bacterium]|nr:hypothetical protein [bacterium]MYC67226.1 hypothetical protein [Terriglobia bacterium]